MRPGQQPPARNTRRSVVARNAVKSILGEENAAGIENQANSGKLSLAELDSLARKGQEFGKGVVSIVFGTGNPREVALGFLASDRFEAEIQKKSASHELIGMLGPAFDIYLGTDSPLATVRERLARHVLMTDLVTCLGPSVPRSLTSAKTTVSPGARDDCVSTAQAWRVRRGVRDSYVTTAGKVEQEGSLPEGECLRTWN
jgi:hypothetical protein